MFKRDYKALELMPLLLHNVVVYPERYGYSGAWCNGEPIALAHLMRNGRQSRRQVFYSPPVRTVEEPCIWGGNYQWHYGHFLIESMQNLHAFKQHPERRIIWRNGTPEDFSKRAWQKKIMDLTGCGSAGVEFVTEPTLFNDLLLPVPGFFYGTWLSQEQADAFGVYHTDVQKGKKVWLSRSDVRSDNIVYTNEPELEAMLEARGWLVYHPEKHSLEEQLEMLGSAEVVMGVIGSAFHSLIMLKEPRTRYIVIDRMNGSEMAHNKQFDLIAKVRSDNYYVWQPPKHDAKPLYRRTVHVHWPWYSFDLEAIKQGLDRTGDFSEDLSDIAGMEHIRDRNVDNPVGIPVQCCLDTPFINRVHYFYRRLPRLGHRIKRCTAFVTNLLARRHPLD